MLLDRCGYADTDIIIMTEEAGVKDEHRPTKFNLVRTFPLPRPGFAYPDDAFSLRNVNSRPSVVR